MSNVWGGRPRPPICHSSNFASDLPRKNLQWPGAMSSLTVARQRGIFTRFPVLLKARRTREPIQKQPECKCCEQAVSTTDLEACSTLRVGLSPDHSDHTTSTAVCVTIEAKICRSARQARFQSRGHDSAIVAGVTFCACKLNRNGS